MEDVVPMAEAAASPVVEGEIPTATVTEDTTISTVPDPVSEDTSEVTTVAAPTSVFGESGVSAGVEHGLSFVQSNPAGTIPGQLQSYGPDSRQMPVSEAAGDKFGKSFEFRS